MTQVRHPRGVLIGRGMDATYKRMHEAYSPGSSV